MCRRGRNGAGHTQNAPYWTTSLHMTGLRPKSHSRSDDLPKFTARFTVRGKLPDWLGAMFFKELVRSTSVPTPFPKKSPINSFESLTAFISRDHVRCCSFQNCLEVPSCWEVLSCVTRAQM